MWTDFEFACRGPREVDVATNETVAAERGRRPEDDDFLAGYGEHDRELLAAVTPLSLVPFVAWTFRLAAERPEALGTARARLDVALEGLRSM